MVKKTYSANEALHRIADLPLAPRSGAQKKVAGQLGIRQNTLSGLTAKRRKNVGTRLSFALLLAAKDLGVLDQIIKKSKEYEVN